MTLICFCLLNYSHPLTHYNRKLKQNCNRQNHINLLFVNKSPIFSRKLQFAN